MQPFKIKGVIASAAFAVALFGASAASAVTVTYDSYVTGDNLGSGPQATLTYSQNGSDVDFSLLNSLNSIATAFISGIGFTYGGSIPTGVINLAGSDAVVTGLGAGNSFSGEGLDVDFAALFQNNNSGGGAGRLVVGETAMFRILNAQASLFDFSALNTGIRAQGLANGGSTKYTVGDDGDTGGPSPVPLPAGFPLLASALGLAVFLRKRRT